jgi:hypothetical protein
MVYLKYMKDKNIVVINKNINKGKVNKKGKTYDQILSIPIPPDLQSEYLKEVFGLTDEDIDKLK